MGKPIFRPNGAILAILSPKNPQKTTKMAISQNATFPQTQSPKSLLLLHFLPNRLKIWRYGVKLNFSLNLCFRFLKKIFKNFLLAFFQKKVHFFWKKANKKFLKFFSKI